MTRTRGGESEMTERGFNQLFCSRFDDFDDAIDEAIEEDFRDLCGGEWRNCRPSKAFF